MPVVVRPETPADHAAAEAVVEAAFADPALARLVAELRDEPSYRAGRALVAVDGEEVVGHVLVTDSTVVGDAGVVGRIATLSPLAVAPDRQRSGIGTALVEAVVAVCDAEGEPAVVLEGDPAYYGRLGFELAAPHGLIVPLPDWAPPEAAQVRRLTAWTDGLRGTVRYSAPFDRLPH